MVNGLGMSLSPGRCGRSMNMFPLQNRASSSGPCSGTLRGPDVVAGVRLAGSALAVVLWFTLVSYPARANPVAGAATFVLQAGSANLGDYFPTYLANGYFSTMSSRRGTMPAHAYMVAFMDYTPGDISRPAVLPGWSGIDVNDGHAWLNRVSMTPATFQHYRQTLNMYDGTLRTRYRWVDGSRTTVIKVSSFVSMREVHLSVTSIRIRTDYSGLVRLRFGLHVWPAPKHRFALARLSLAAMRRAVLASGQQLVAVGPATPDRAAIWYPGQTLVDASATHAGRRLLWLRGEASDGLKMGMAVALGLPKVRGTSFRVMARPHHHELEVMFHAVRGHSYRFTKFVSVSRAGWGRGAGGDVQRAKAARAIGYFGLLARQKAAWHRLWRSDIVVQGDPALQKVIHADLFYLLENSSSGTAWGMAANGFSPNYAGHVFWDSDSWDFPVLLLLHPQRARSLVMFRDRTLAAAKARAQRLGYRGAMYPWESDPQYGTDQTPHFAWRNSSGEIHIDADIAIAQWQYYLATGDLHWLREHGWPVIRAVAQFWTSRVVYQPATRRYEILHVVSPDEKYNNVDNDTFTNAVARKALHIAVKAARRLGKRPDPRWARIAANMSIPFSVRKQQHLDFGSGAQRHDHVTWMGSTLPLLTYPSLDMQMPMTVRRNDFRAVLQALQNDSKDPNEMMLDMISIEAATLGDTATAYHWLQRNLVGFLKPPFDVRSETATNNVGYILATSAGFLQNFIYGFTGLRVEDGGVVQAYPPILPRAWISLTLKNVSLRGRRYNIVVRHDAMGKVILQRRLLPRRISEEPE